MSISAPVTARTRSSAKVSRRLRLLRAHGLIKKVPKTRRYVLTQHGRLLTAALRATRDATIRSLLRQPSTDSTAIAA